MTSEERGRPGGPRPHGAQTRTARGPAATTVLVIIALAVFLYLLRSILLPFVLPLIVAYVCGPLVRWLARRLRVPRWIAALAVLLALLAATTLAGWVAIPPLLRTIERVAGDLRGTSAALANELLRGRSLDLLGQRVDAASIADQIAAVVSGWLGSSARMLEVAGWSFAVLFGFILSWVLLAYFLIDGPRIARGILWLVAPAHRAFAARVCSELDPVLRRYYVGVGLIGVYASCAAYLGLRLLLGLRHAVLLAILTGILEVIPVIGPATAAIIGGIAATQQATSAWGILGYIVYAFALRISIDQFVGPLVLGRAGHVSPVLVIFCFLAGGVLFGIVGVIVAVPVALGIKVALRVLYEEPSTRSG